MGNPDHKKQVYDILLTPIECRNRKDKVDFVDGRIISGQKYYGEKDEDMSDFTVGFYEIVYKDLLKCMTLLNSKGELYNAQFDGDTMNSFNTIANFTTNAGKSIAKRTPLEEWPEYLKDYRIRYHCLANFWILPMDIGRTSRKLNKYDSMCLFVKDVNSYYEYKARSSENIKEAVTCINNDSEYFKRIESMKHFCDIHFISDVGIIEKAAIEQKQYEERCSEILVSSALEMIERRATEISNSKYSYELREYFHKMNLL